MSNEKITCDHYKKFPCDHCNGSGRVPWQNERVAIGRAGPSSRGYVCGKCLGDGVFAETLPDDVTPLHLLEGMEADTEFTIRFNAALQAWFIFPVDRWEDYLNWQAACKDEVENIHRSHTDSSANNLAMLSTLRATLRGKAPSWVCRLTTGGSSTGLRFRFPTVTNEDEDALTEDERQMLYSSTGKKAGALKSIQLV